MTDPTDYTTLPEVLAACGMTFDVEWKTWRVAGVLRPSPETLNAPPRPTMQELWEGLCKAWEARYIDPLDKDVENLLRCGQPAISGMSHVVLWEPGETHFYRVSEYGTLTNTVAAALHWVLQQKKEG